MIQSKSETELPEGYTIGQAENWYRDLTPQEATKPEFNKRKHPDMIGVIDLFILGYLMTFRVDCFCVVEWKHYRLTAYGKEWKLSCEFSGQEIEGTYLTIGQLLEVYRLQLEKAVLKLKSDENNKTT